VIAVTDSDSLQCDNNDLIGALTSCGVVQVGLQRRD